MRNHKFDEYDREKVITVIEKHFGVTLARLPGKKRFLEDKLGRSFWILGGYDNWHGIPTKMFAKEKERVADGILVVAKRYKNRIDIFSGSLQPLIDNKERLSRTQDDLQFNIRIRENILSVNEIDGYYLHKLDNTDFSDDDKSKVKADHKVKTIIRKLSHEQRKELVEQILSGKHNNSQERTE